MKLKLLDINEVTLETKDKLCKENISLVVDNTNIIPENIKSGVSILGVNGTLQSGGGGGGTAESCTVTFNMGSRGAVLNIYWTDENLEWREESYWNPVTISCLKNSIIVIDGCLAESVTGGIVELINNNFYIAVLVESDGTITYTG